MGPHFRSPCFPGPRYGILRTSNFCVVGAGETPFKDHPTPYCSSLAEYTVYPLGQLRNFKPLESMTKKFYSNNNLHQVFEGISEKTTALVEPQIGPELPSASSFTATLSDHERSRKAPGNSRC